MDQRISYEKDTVSSNDIENQNDIMERIRRWRLILGAQSQNRFSSMNQEWELTEEQLLMDQALAAIYNKTSEGGFAIRRPEQGEVMVLPIHILKWLGDVRTLFDKDLVKIVQADAMERCGLKQLLLEPELLEHLEPDVNLASTLLMLKDQIPKRSKESVRTFIQRSWRRSTNFWRRISAVL